MEVKEILVNNFNIYSLPDYELIASFSFNEESEEKTFIFTYEDDEE